MLNVVACLIVPALINFSLFFYAVIVLPANRVNRLFSLFIFLLGIEQLADAMMHGSANAEVASMWQHISLAPWVFIAPIGALLAYALTEPEGSTKNGKIYTLLLAPALIFQFMVAAHLDRSTLVLHPVWGWISNPVSDATTLSIYFFIAGVGLLMPVLLWNAYFRNRKNPQHGKQFLLLAIGVTVPYVGGVISEVILPVSFDMNTIPVSGPLMTTFTVCAMIAIRNYRMLDYSPRHQFERILETMAEGVMITDNGGRVMYVNPALARMTECDPGEMMGHTTDFFLLGEEDRVFIPKGTQEIQLRSKTGEKIWVVASASPCVDANGKEIGITCMITDVDQLKKSLSTITRNEMRLNRAQEVSHVGSWDLNFSTGHVTWSEEACRIYGFDPSQRNQSFDTWISMIHPADLPGVMLEVKKSQENGVDCSFEHRIVLRDGTVKHVQSISKHEYDDEGKLTGLFGICKDITGMKRAEQKLRATTAELETYIYKSSHDMHAPLASILGLINVSRMEIYEPTATRYIQMIESQVKKLDSVRVEFIKAMHINEATKLNEEVHVKTMIGDILRDLRMTEGFSRMSINVNVAPGQKLVSNEFLMRTILQNLIENSIKYQDYSLDKPQLFIDLEQRGQTTNITIEDNGIGIDPVIQDKIFDMYFKTTEIREGSGLGLYLVKKAVEKLDAKLSLRSIPGHGTRFTLSFVQAN